MTTANETPSGHVKFRRDRRNGGAVAVLLLLCTLSAALLVGAPADEKHVSIYSSAANYSAAITERGGQEYVSLLDVLKPLGSTSAKTDGKHWKLRYDKVEGEFTPGKVRAKVQGHSFDLPANFLLENGRGLVPVSSLTGLLPRYVGAAVMYYEASRRILVGGVGVHFTAQVKNTVPPGLVMDFSAPVNPSISTEPGMLRMTFTHEPVVPSGTPILTFSSNIITSASYQETNGAAEIVVNSTAPLFATFSNDGKTITIASPPPNATNAATSSAANTTPSSAPSGLGLHHPLVVIDASHGGLERGAALTDQLAEKDVTLLFARRLRQELQSRGVSAFVLRDGDDTLTLDQRASMVDQQQPAIYVCLHASSQGTGVRLYSAVLPAGGEDRGLFLDWNTAQSRFLMLGRSAEVDIAAQLQKNQVPARILFAPLRPLNNIVVPALAIEIAPPSTEISDLTSPGYQQTVSSSIASSIVGMKDKLGVRQ